MLALHERKLLEWFQCAMSELSEILENVSPVEEHHLGEFIRPARRIFMNGQGRSGLVVRMAAMRLMQLGREAYVLGDATTPAIQSGDLLIAVSGSGETEGVVRVARRAKALGAQVAVVSAMMQSSLADCADHLTVIPGRSPKISFDSDSQLPLASTLEQAMLLFFDCMVAWLAAQEGQDNTSMMARHANLE